MFMDQNQEPLTSLRREILYAEGAVIPLGYLRSWGLIISRCDRSNDMPVWFVC